MLELVMYAAIAPLALLLVTSVWIYPAVLEELVKWVILRMNFSENIPPSIKQGILVGLVFGLSESVLYMTNAWASSQWEVILHRLILAVPMHGLTAGIIAVGMKRKVTWVGVVVAMVVHGLYNYWVK